MSTRVESSFTPAANAPMRTPHDPPRIILAEDDPDMRNVIAEVRRKDGYVVHEAQDGGRLLVRVTARYLDVDLIISDIRMPICTGLQNLVPPS